MLIDGVFNEDKIQVRKEEITFNGDAKPFTCSILWLCSMFILNISWIPHQQGGSSLQPISPFWGVRGVGRGCSVVHTGTSLPSVPG